MHLSYNVQLIIPLAFFENGLILLGMPVFLNVAPFEIIVGLFLRVSTPAKLGVGVCGGLVTPLALLEKGFTLLPEESVILLDGTPLRWIGGVLFLILAPLMSAAGQSSGSRSWASAFLDKGLTCPPEYWVVISNTVFLNTASFEITAWLFLTGTVSAIAKLGAGVCGGLVTPLALLEKGFTLLPEESVILLDGTQLSWAGGVFFSTSVPTMLVARQLSVCRSSASASLENGLIRVPEDRMVILDTRCLGWIGGAYLSTSAVSNLFRELCAGRSKRFSSLEVLTLWATEPVILLNSSPLWDGEAFFFISALTKLPSGGSDGWHFNLG